MNINILHEARHSEHFEWATTHHGFFPGFLVPNWRHILSGCQFATDFCDWGIQYHLCSTYRGLWGLVVIQLAEPWRLKPEVSWVDSRWLLAWPFSSICTSQYLITTHSRLQLQNTRTYIAMQGETCTQCAYTVGTDMLPYTSSYIVNISE